MKNNIAVLAFLLTAFSCNKFEYNVYEVDRQVNDPVVKTQYNIDRLLKLPRKDTLHVVFFGDPQRFYDDTEDLVEAVNALPLVDAVFICGDLADFGLNREYYLINQQLKLLKVPFVTVVGNHDCLGNGLEVYEDTYGPVNYSFTWNDVRFVGLNTCGREFNFNGHVPDLNWMQQQVEDSANFEGCIFFSHVGPNNGDFDQALEDGYVKITEEAKNTIFSINGHNHSFAIGQPYDDGIWYLNTSSPSNRVYSYVTIYPYSPDEKKFDCIPVGF